MLRTVLSTLSFCLLECYYNEPGIRILAGKGNEMKKKFLFVLMLLCLALTATACKIGSADQAETSAEGETTESMHAEESRALELDPDSEGALGPN